MNPTDNRVLVFAGSARAHSYNKHLARLAATRVEDAGGQATFVDLRDYPIPLYDGDLEQEQGIPEHARRLKELLATHAGLIVVSPEYNGFITPLLKNTLDWLSRPDGEENGLALFRNRVACVLSASPGGFGGMRSPLAWHGNCSPTSASRRCRISSPYPGPARLSATTAT